MARRGCTCVPYSPQRSVLAKRWRILGICWALASCGRVVEISAVDRPEVPEPELDSDADEAPAEVDAEIDASMELPSLAPDANDEPAMNTPIDAAIDARVADGGPRDAGSRDGAAPARDAGTDAMLPVCGGARALELCWYLGNAGASCEQTCSGKGGYDARATALLGTSAQGGNLGACAQVLAGLGYTGNVTPGFRSDGIGLGCHLWESEGRLDGWWLVSMPDFDPRASIQVASIACACVR